MTQMNRSQRSMENYISKEPHVDSQSVVVSANSVNTVSFNIEGNYDLEFFRFSYKSTGLFKIQFLVNQKKIFPNPVTSAVFSGYMNTSVLGQLLWHTFKTPLFVYRNTNLIASITDVSGSSNTVEIVIDGIKYLYTV